VKHKKIVIRLLVVATLVSVAAQAPHSPGQVRLASSTTQQDDYMTLSSSEVQAGGTIGVTVKSQHPISSRCGGDATSPGFVAPIVLSPVGHTIHTGEGLVITSPGVYVVTVPCESESPLTQSFTIVGGPSTSPPSNPPTNPPPKVVKPVGAPQTGGGGTS
jgi:hypothetical protein